MFDTDQHVQLTRELLKTSLGSAANHFLPSSATLQ